VEPKLPLDFGERRGSSQEYLHIQPKRLMIDVKHIGFHPLIKVKITPAAGLPEAGDARLHVEVAAVLLEDRCNIKPFVKIILTVGT
jgi:hypothetical protein